MSQLIFEYGSCNTSENFSASSRHNCAGSQNPGHAVGDPLRQFRISNNPKLSLTHRRFSELNGRSTWIGGILDIALGSRRVQLQTLQLQELRRLLRLLRGSLHSNGM